MKLYSRYVGWLYFKYFMILFVALSMFYVGVDALTNLKELPTSANLKLLYFGLIALSGVSYVMPLSLLLALILSKFSMIKSNELVSLYALGINKNAIIRPPFFIALFITMIYVGANFTPFAYSLEFGRNILKTAQISTTSQDIFIKFEGKFIYIGKLNPINGEANDVRIFDINDSKLKSATFASSGKFIDAKWQIKDVNTTTLPTIFKLGEKGLERQDFAEFATLSNFKPKTIENAVSSGSAVSILDALDFIFAFKSEGVEIKSARTTLYTLGITPFFAPFLVLIIYYFLPASERFVSLALSNFVFILAALVVWGVLFILTRFAQNNIISPEIAIILPIFCIISYAFSLYFRHR